MAETIYLVEATPRNPGVGTVTVRLSSKRSHARDVIKNNLEWKPALDTAPAQTIKLLGEDQLPGILEIDHGSLGIVFSPDLGNDVWSQYQWDGAALSVWRGESGGAFGTFTKVFTGRCGPLERPSADVGALPLRGAEADLDKDLLTATYAGTGAAEGDLALKGAYKPWMSGPCEGVAGVLVSKVYWVWQLHGYGAIDAVTAAYEGGLTLGASSGDYASYAALIAATIPDGGWATCLALGLVRLKNEPSKPVVFDARGAKDGATYVSKAGAIASHLIKQAGVSGGSINTTSASNVDAAFPYDWNFYTASQWTVGDVVRKAMADIGGYTFPDENGTWRFGRYKAIKSASPLTSRRTALPLVQSVAQKSAMSPVGRVEIGARRCWTLHREDDISPALLDAITSADAAAAAAQAAAAAAQATNSVNLYRVEAAGVTSSIALAGAGISEVRFGNANGLDLTPAASNVVNIVLAEVGLVPGDVISVSALLAYSDAGGDDARLRVRFKDAAGAEVGLTTGNPQATPLAETRFELPNLTIPAGTAAITVGSRLTGGTGTATVRNVMVNRGPICAPYTPPTRGADFTATSSVGINFNARNDRNAAAVTAPSLPTDGTVIDHVINADGSADISVEWIWGGAEADIDGFIVYVYRSASASAYTFGTTPQEEQTFFVAPDRRALLIYGVPADAYYTFGVRAYRIVDPDVNAAGRILSTLVKATGSGENPYRPSASVAFAGNVSGTVGGSAASTVAAGALAANNGVNSDGTIKDDKVTTPAIVDGGVTNKIAFYNAAAVTLPESWPLGGIKTTLGTITLTTTGESVILAATFTTRNAGGTSYVLETTIRRTTGGVPTTVRNDWGNKADGGDARSWSLSMTDEPPAGTHTYDLLVAYISNAGVNGQGLNRSFYGMEFKK